MRRLVALVTAAAFMAATPVFAQSAPSAGSGQQTSDSSSGMQSIVNDQSLLLDGQDANAQQNPPGDSPNGLTTPLLVGLGVAGAAGLIIAVASSHHNNNSVNNSVSP